jgi:hypothetical protein
MTVQNDCTVQLYSMTVQYSTVQYSTVPVISGGTCNGSQTYTQEDSVQCTVYSVQCTVYSVQCTVYSVQCTVYSVQCTVQLYSMTIQYNCTV